jgi:lysophospholipase L1-like esterase
MDPAEQQACVLETFSAIGANLTLITNKLFAASDGVFPVLGMNYYNPFLNAWFLGPPQGPALVTATTTLVVGLNTQVLAPVYGLSGFPVADVATAFNTTDATLVPFPLPPPFDMVPLNVATACQLTYLCPAMGSGLEPNIHPNTAGYNVIANVFLALFNSL